MFLHALLLTIIVVIIPTAFGLINSYSPTRTISAAAIAVAVGTLLNWGVFFWIVPGIGFNAVILWHNFWWLFFEFLIMTLVIAFVSIDWDSTLDRGWSSSRRSNRKVGVGAWTGLVVAAVVFVVGLVFGGGGVFSQGRASQLAGLLNVTVHEKPSSPSEPIAVPPTDDAHMLMVPRQVANNSAKQALTGNIGTIYELQVRHAELASVGGTLQWAYPLAPSNWQTQNRVDGIVPGYISVNAENPSLPAVPKVDDLGTDKVQYRMKYYPEGYWGHSIDRLIWAKYPSSVITDITLEPDDTGKPYFTATIDRLTLNMQPTVPETLLVIDAWTGDIVEHALNNIPDWVDRVYSQATVEHMLDWWGEWGNPKSAPYALMFQNSADRYKVDKDRNPELVYVKGGHPFWQTVMTSYNSDTTGTYYALVDARTAKTDLYKIDGLSLEGKASDTISHAGDNLRKLVPAHLTIHNIYGRLTWVAPMLREGAPLGETDESPFLGLALLPVDAANNSSALVLKYDGDVKADALATYRQFLANGTDVSGPSENSQKSTIEGQVLRVGQPIKTGNEYSYTFILKEDPNHVYTAETSKKDRPELPFIREGTRVRITYFDTGDAYRTVVAYDDLDLQIG